MPLLPATLRQLDHDQRRTVLASFLGWTLDAFDCFLLVLVIGEIARGFHTGHTRVAGAVADARGASAGALPAA
ncbi:hypothetical protein [Fulvimonas soli]|jgi:SHS family lactate transporter-like MFS transporter|uniref:MFS transporter n=1 Tax=Fulvimonas soli TaxID=155197 RepID=A0A316I4L8_9GAMM|nr:hypothetical protein [Fulvimonas soli]PWK87617.1 hypothetical protein C7456_106110 [Fulvimonas soli]TNY25802.1 hypothetical protein BV497_11980 [Fulvimonas soli]